MCIIVIFLTLLTIITSGLAIFPSCVPNAQFSLNDRLCYCNENGQWSEAACNRIEHHKSCQPGQIIWEGCSQCICQEDRKLLCTASDCGDDSSTKRITPNDNPTELLCTPLRSYYKNCSLCVCPVSGKLSLATCVTDSNCEFKNFNVSLETVKQKSCIPKVIYLFNCFSCVCSKNGRFSLKNCVETCQQLPDPSRACIPKAFYRINCNVCLCPANGIRDKRLCSQSNCDKFSSVTTLTSIRNKSVTCIPYRYTKAQCIYCQCKPQGVIDETSCLEQECLKVKNISYDFIERPCNLGEIVPICMECFCPSTGRTDEKFCTRVCSLQSKVVMLENILKQKEVLIDPKRLMVISGTDTCDPNSVFLDESRYCLCPNSGKTNFKQCTSVVVDTVPKKMQTFKLIGRSDTLNFNITCQPNTFIEIGCDTCYCTKNGTIDKKWCTFDDCDAKKMILQAQQNQSKSNGLDETGVCIPGSISKKACNFCICSESGLMKDRTCTNSTCTEENQPASFEYLCDPSSYFTVDCNICFCPLEGVKNVLKCTKIHCENSFLRTTLCTPGALFSDDCNICVCPPNGKKKDKVCTSTACSHLEAPWRKIFKLSDNLLGMNASESKSLDLCFPGDEFEDSCRICSCPEVGLRMYANCYSNMCEDDAKFLSYTDVKYIKDIPRFSYEMELDHTGDDDETQVDDDDVIDMANFGVEDRVNQMKNTTFEKRTRITMHEVHRN